MRVVIAGGHGQIARRLEKQLTMRGDHATGIIRQTGHAADLAAAGAAAIIADLERCAADDLVDELRGVDAVVFAAGAGPGSGVTRKDTVDRQAAALLADAAEMAGVRRYLLISALGAADEPAAGATPDFAAYLRAKNASEIDLRRRDLSWTIVRPGRLTNQPGTNRVLLSPATESGEISRDDVASVLLALLDEPRTAGTVLELIEGDMLIRDAVAHIADSAPPPFGSPRPLQ